MTTWKATPKNTGASQVACNIVNAIFDLDGMAVVKQHNHWECMAAAAVHIVDRETAAKKCSHCGENAVRPLDDEDWMQCDRCDSTFPPEYQGEFMQKLADIGAVSVPGIGKSSTNVVELDNYDINGPVWRKVKEKLGGVAVWSMYEYRPEDKHDWKGVAISYFLRLYPGQRGSIWATIEGDTMLDVYKACDLLIRKSGDSHHIFIEGVKEEDGKLTLHTGS